MGQPTVSRAPNELRTVTFEPDYVIYPEGSVLVSVGNTKVLCTATVQESVPRWIKHSSKRHGWVTAEYAMLPGSTQSRTNRETFRPKGRTQEITRLIGRSLRAAVDLSLLGDRQITVDCDVIQADGGTRTASITGGYVALALAVQRMHKRELFKAYPLTHAVAAVSVGMVEGQGRLDLDYDMDLAAEVDLNVVMVGDGRFVEVQGTAEGDPFSRDDLNAMLTLAEQGIGVLIAMQAEVLASVQA